MELAELRAFVTVAETLHFGKAAERLHLAQPHVSRVVRKLESELGVALFERTTRRVVLTAAGQAFVEPAHQVLATLADARRRLQSIARGVRGTVRLSFAGPSSYAAIGQLSRRVREQHPDIDLVLRPGRFGAEVFDQLLEGSTDLTILRFDELPDGIEARPIMEEHYVIAAPERHPLADRGTISLAELRDEPFIALPARPGSVVRSDFIAWCERLGFTPNIVQDAPDSWTIAALVSAGVGLTFSVDTALDHVSTEGITRLRLQEDTDPVYAYLAWRSNNDDPVLATVLRATEELFPTVGPAAERR